MPTTITLPFTLTNGSTADATEVQDNLDEIVTEYNTSVAAVTGSIVGTTATQTLTNKTLTAPIISTISNTGTITLPTSTDTLVGKATTDTLTNKTLTSPKIGTAILDTNGNEIVETPATSSAVNHIKVTNAVTTAAPKIEAVGDDTNINLDLQGKGTGVVKKNMRIQSNTTNTTETGVFVQAGWGFVVGDGDSTGAKTVTFPTAFNNIFAVVISTLGYKDSSDPSGIGDFTDIGADAKAVGVSTTTFAATVSLYSGTFTSTRRIGYSWVAYGN